MTATSFLKSETGAVTVDWVVLTAGLVGLGLATMTVVSSGVEQTATDIDEELSTQIIQTSFPSPSPEAEDPVARSWSTYTAYNLAQSTQEANTETYFNTYSAEINALLAENSYSELNTLLDNGEDLQSHVLVGSWMNNMAAHLSAIEQQGGEMPEDVDAMWATIDDLQADL